MANAIILGIVALILGSAITYIIIQKKKGVKCIGCSVGGKCHCNSAPKEQNSKEVKHSECSCSCCTH